jgi:Uma2 family endonuclease
MIKLSRYAEGGIGQYWIVDPAVPSIEIYDLIDGAYVLVAQGSGDDDVAVAAPFPVTVVPRQLVDN